MNCLQKFTNFFFALCSPLGSRRLGSFRFLFHRLLAVAIKGHAAVCEAVEPESPAPLAEPRLLYARVNGIVGVLAPVMHDQPVVLRAVQPTAGDERCNQRFAVPGIRENVLQVLGTDPCEVALMTELGDPVPEDFEHPDGVDARDTQALGK